ncbi:response regulator transcription factor [Vibrio astriarenae]
MTHCLILSTNPKLHEPVKQILELSFPDWRICHAKSLSEAMRVYKRNFELVLFDDCTLTTQSYLGYSPSTHSAKWILLNHKYSDICAEEHLNQGFDGYIAMSETNLDQLVSICRSVMEGELWYKRKVMSDALNYYREQSKHKDAMPDFHLFHFDFTKRERDLAQLLLLGFRNREIAEHLNISIHTVKTHVSHILKKCGAESRNELLVKLHEQFHTTQTH